MKNDVSMAFEFVRNPDVEKVNYDNSFDDDQYNHLLSTIAGLRNHARGFSVVIQVIDSPVLNTNSKLTKQMELFVESLTRRELEVYNLAMRGFSNRTIAEKLFITEETVKSHRKNIVGKAGVRNVDEIKSRILEANKLIK